VPDQETSRRDHSSNIAQATDHHKMDQNTATYDQATGEQRNYAATNRLMEIRLDTSGLYKRRATHDIDDNRRNYSILDTKEDDLRDKASLPLILSNIMFLPTKSKGAAPKRYGPRRLGTRPKSPMVDQSDSELDEDEDISFNVSESDVSLTEISDKMINRSDSMKVLCDQTISEYEAATEGQLELDSGQVNHNQSQEGITFVEDHFGLYTGAVASGFSKNSQGAILNNNMFGTTVEGGHVGAEHSGQISILQTGSVVPNTSINSHSADIEMHVREFPHEPQDIRNDKPTNDFSEASHNDFAEYNEAQTGTPVKRTKRRKHRENGALPDDGMIGGFLNRATENEQIQMNEEVIELCERCKTRRDLCSCLCFPRETRLMMAFSPQKVLPQKASDRFSKIGNSEIPWPRLKSDQACYAKTLKSCKTNIGHDNRLSFKFELKKSDSIKCDISTYDECCHVNLRKRLDSVDDTDKTSWKVESRRSSSGSVETTFDNDLDDEEIDTQVFVSQNNGTGKCCVQYENPQYNCTKVNYKLPYQADIFSQRINIKGDSLVCMETLQSYGPIILSEMRTDGSLVKNGHDDSFCQEERKLICVLLLRKDGDNFVDTYECLNQETDDDKETDIDNEFSEDIDNEFSEDIDNEFSEDIDNEFSEDIDNEFSGDNDNEFCDEGSQERKEIIKQGEDDKNPAV